ncbi:DUF3169 family protein [Streptococcus dentiloxodontae]
MKKVKKQNGMIARILKQLLLGGAIGAVLGFAVFFGMGVFNIPEEGFPFSQESVTNFFVIVLRGVYLIAMIVSIIYIISVRKNYKIYQTMNDDDSEELYRVMNRKHSYAILFDNIAIVFAMLSMALSYKFTFDSDSVQAFFPIFDFVFLIIFSFLQSYIFKVYNRIRGIKMPLVPTVKELKNNIMQMDEAELEANYEMSFDIVMTLNNIILPAIYVGLFFLSIILQKTELVGMLVAGVIHLYILIMNFKMTNKYYR